MLAQSEGDRISPLVRGLAGLFGGAFAIGGVFMWATVLLPRVFPRHPTSAWGVFETLAGGIGCVHVARILIRAARTGISPPRSSHSLKPEESGQPDKRLEQTRR